MREKNGFVISTTLYSIFGIMLLTVFYILYALSNNRYTLSNSIDGIKENFNTLYSKDKSGANAPILAEGMIPVTYDFDNDVWVRADTSSEWYNYDEQWWANAVTTTSTNRQKYLSDEHIGKEIPMDEINSMWVWIPRYSYIQWTNATNPTITTPIEIVFETGTAVKETGYITHPAFRDIDNMENTTTGAWDEELTGFWVGKFATGTSSATCNLSPSEANCEDVDPIIKPDVKTLGVQRISSQFITSLKFAGGTLNYDTGAVTFSTNADNIYGLNTTTNKTDTHMMKNTEWGAVAILSQSKYGKIGNDSYKDTNKIIYPNNSMEHYTGRSFGKSSDDASLASDELRPFGTYSYNDKLCIITTNTDLGNICVGSKTLNSGQGASTTGNIYGIYDISGVNQYMMGSYAGYAGFNYYRHSGFYGTITEYDYEIALEYVYPEYTEFPPKKYYDVYPENYLSIFGDGCIETNLLGLRCADPNEQTIWTMRGSGIALSGYSGDGGGLDDSTWRAVLIPPQP